MVERFLTEPTLADVRQELNMGSLAPGRVRVLTDTADLAVCRTLRDGLQLGARPVPRKAFYYYADGFYFIPAVYQLEPGDLYIGHSSLLILDRNLIPLKSIAM